MKEYDKYENTKIWKCEKHENANQILKKYEH